MGGERGQIGVTVAHGRGHDEVSHSLKQRLIGIQRSRPATVLAWSPDLANTVSVAVVSPTITRAPSAGSRLALDVTRQGVVRTRGSRLLRHQARKSCERRRSVNVIAGPPCLHLRMGEARMFQRLVRVRTS